MQVERLEKELLNMHNMFKTIADPIHRKIATKIPITKCHARSFGAGISQEWKKFYK